MAEKKYTVWTTSAADGWKYRADGGLPNGEERLAQGGARNDQMIICCAAPLLILAAVAFFGISLGALASGFFSVAALLACPLGMYLMMRMMSKDKQ